MALHTPIIDASKAEIIRRGHRARRRLRADRLVLPGDADGLACGAAIRAGCAARASKPRVSPTRRATRKIAGYPSHSSESARPLRRSDHSMEFGIHQQVLLARVRDRARAGRGRAEDAFLHHGRGLRLGQHGRHRPHALVGVRDGGGARGVVALEATGTIIARRGHLSAVSHAAISHGCAISSAVFMFGIGMTLGSGCGNRTLVRIGGGNVKSLTVLARCRGLRVPDDVDAAFREGVSAVDPGDDASISHRYGMPTQESARSSRACSAWSPRARST